MSEASRRSVERSGEPTYRLGRIDAHPLDEHGVTAYRVSRNDRVIGAVVGFGGRGWDAYTVDEGGPDPSRPYRKFGVGYSLRRDAVDAVKRHRVYEETGRAIAPSTAGRSC